MQGSRGSIHPILYTLGTRLHFCYKETLSEFHKNNSNINRYMQSKVNRKFENLHIRYMGSRTTIDPMLPIFNPKALLANVSPRIAVTNQISIKRRP